MKAKDPRRAPNLNYSRIFETGIIIAIAACVIFLNMFTTKKFTDLEEAAHDALFVVDSIPISEDDVFAEQIRDYLPDTYKMIELYDINLELLLRIQFDNDQTEPRDIRENDEIMSVIANTTEGQAHISVGEMEQDFYYRWLENSKGEMRLLTVYSKIHNVQNLWVFSFVCYLIMVLIFILLIRLHIRRYQDHISRYRESTNNLSSSMKS